MEPGVYQSTSNRHTQNKWPEGLTGKGPLGKLPVLLSAGISVSVAPEPLAGAIVPPEGNGTRRASHASGG
jgi:hypothetical protein